MLMDTKLCDAEATNFAAGAEPVMVGPVFHFERASSMRMLFRELVEETKSSGSLQVLARF